MIPVRVRVAVIHFIRIDYIFGCLSRVMQINKLQLI